MALAGLKPSRTSRRLAWLVLAVVLLHVLGLRWVSGHMLPPTALRQMVDPMFTRVLQPQEPPPPAPATPLAAAVPRRPALSALPAQPEPSVPSTPTQTAATSPETEPDTQPDLVPENQAQAEPAEPPVSAASAAEAGKPEQVASAPEPAATPATVASAAESDKDEAGDRWPNDTRLSYTLQGQYMGGPLYGAAQVQWQRQDTLYQTRVSMNVSLAGTRVLTSQGEVRPEGLIPRVYEETRGNSRRTVRLTDTEIILSDDRAIPRPPDVQDTASQFVELGHRFASGRAALELGGSVDVLLARPGGVDLWTYDIVARELLRTPRHGDIEAWRLRPRPVSKPRGNISAEIWYAPTLQYLPVRIRVTMGEEAFVDLQLDVIEQR